jgi:hypothetical protein
MNTAAEARVAADRVSAHGAQYVPLGVQSLGRPVEGYVREKTRSLLSPASCKIPAYV